jgi:cobalt-zinc-cadmium efflux system outer membrane protein
MFRSSVKKPKVRRPTSLAVWLALTTTALTGAGVAQTVREPLSRQEAVALFLAGNPDIEAARLWAERVRADQIAADLRPNPELTVTAENFRVAGETPFGRLYEVAVTYSETLELGGKRRLRNAVADLGASAADARLDGVRRQGVLDVERLYLEAVLAREQRDVGLGTADSFAELLDDIEARFEEGAASQGDLIRVRLEGVRIDRVARDAELALERATIRLTERLGAVEFDRWTVADDLNVTASVPDLLSLREIALAERPELRAARTEAGQGEQNIALQRARATPDIQPFVGYKRVASSDTVLFGVSLPLHFRDRNQDGIARAMSDQRIAESQVVAVTNRVLAEVESAYRAWESARDRVSRFEEGLLVQADDAREIALVSYEEGVAELISLLDAERVNAEMRTAYFEALFDYGISILELEYAAGRDITP